MYYAAGISYPSRSVPTYKHVSAVVAGIIVRAVDKPLATQFRKSVSVMSIFFNTKLQARDAILYYRPCNTV